ncbi:hypothetical protein DL764_008476 [Monosporascus ibericus]|uniref:Heterokaryon incompatibility domain-containing protein n=1 Tax=Monosporascus ibericus TaxID=155417 RepID=A0A4Q4T0F6_9PEZI|nr:hypothetical protein DL764_008476 [Monosporascus ibericus]
MLCPKCEEIDLQLLDDLPQSQQQELQSVSFGSAYYWQQDDAQHYYYYILHDTLAGLALSVEWGCHLCGVIYTALTSPPQWWKTIAVDGSAAANQITPVVLRSWSRKKRKPFAEYVLACLPFPEGIIVTYDGINIELGLFRGLDEHLALPSHTLGLMLHETGSYEADSTTGSQTSLELLKRWLGDCRENHPQCRGPKTPLPTRLIDVGSPEENRQPQLLDTMPGQEGDYLALSHCWGKPELQKETQAWAADPYNLLPLNEWPRTFQQAVQIARALMIRYLWIDTACIRQKDETDFAREASKMAEYYTGATLVVAAVHAQDSRKGCFVARNPLLFRPCPIGFKDCKEKNFFVNVNHKEKPDLAETEPLNFRAWCFQEILLSRRTASFGGDQLRWSCLRRKASETYPSGWQIERIDSQRHPLVFLRTFLHHPFRGALLPTSSKNNSDELVEWQKRIEGKYLLYQPRYTTTTEKAKEIYRNPAYQKWYDCVEYFTKRSITYARDTLPAMSGLAEKMQVAVGTNDIYYAGLWSGDLVRGLLWVVLTPSYGGKESDYTAPSWSWSSRVGQPISSFFDETLMCDPYAEASPNWQDLMAALEPRDLHVEIKLKYPGAVYGEVASGMLQCSVRLLHGGKLGKLLFGEKSIYGKPHPAYHRGLGDRQLHDRIANWRLTIPAGWAVEPGKAAVSTELEGEIALDDFSHPKEQEVSVLLLWPFKFQGDRCIGLGLVRTDARKNEYKRLGRVEFVIPYGKLWAWTQSDAEREEIVIV